MQSTNICSVWIPFIFNFLLDVPYQQPWLPTGRSLSASKQSNVDIYNINTGTLQIAISNIRIVPSKGSVMRRVQGRPTSPDPQAQWLREWTVLACSLITLRIIHANFLVRRSRLPLREWWTYCAYLAHANGTFCAVHPYDRQLLRKNVSGTELVLTAQNGAQLMHSHFMRSDIFFDMELFNLQCAVLHRVKLLALCKR
jgi:hypothetical protein